MTPRNNDVISGALRMPTDSRTRYVRCKNDINAGIARGQKGRYVARLQEVLNVAGFEREVYAHFWRRPYDIGQDPWFVRAYLKVHGAWPLACDGNFGPRTALAVTHFKLLYEIPLTGDGGSIGPKTIERLDACAWEYENDHPAHTWVEGW